MTSTTLPNVQSTGRRIAFYIPVVLFIGLMIGVMAVMIPALQQIFLVWTASPVEEIHLVHGINESLLMWLALLGMATQLIRPVRWLAGVQTAVLVTIILLATTIAAGAFFPPIALFPLLAVIAAALHPARGQLLRVGRPDPAMLILAVLVAIPNFMFAVNHITMQRFAPAGDEHAEFGHWAITAALAMAVPVLALLASFRPSGWRLPAYGAALTAVLFGVGSALWPDQASSIGNLAVIAIVWGAAFIVAAERGRLKGDA